MPTRNMLEQLLAVYTNPESHNAQRHRQTDRRTDGHTDGQQDYANSRSYCVAVRSAKNQPKVHLLEMLAKLLRVYGKTDKIIFNTVE